MLVIRPEQMAVLSAYTSDQFEQRMIEHLRDTFPERTQDLPDERIRLVVRDGMKKADGYHIEYEDDIRRFIEYMVIYGARFDVREESRWIGDVLRRPDLGGTAKMDLIDARELQVLRS